MKLLQISHLLYRYSKSVNEKDIQPFTFEDRDNVFFCDEEGTGPTYEVTDESAFAIRVENEEVQFFRIYCGTSVNDLTVVSPKPTQGIPLTDYELGYLTSYLNCMFESGHIE